jgi:hypothetical protein
VRRRLANGVRLVTQVQAVKTRLSWDVFGAIPEILQTAWDRG